MNEGVTARWRDVSLPNRVLERLVGVRKNGAGFVAQCPNHDDRRPSLSLREGDDGRLLIKCFGGCTTEEVVEALGLGMSDLFPPSFGSNRNGNSKLCREPTAVWPIKDIASVVQAEHVRYDGPEGKQCLWRLPGADEWGLKGRKLSTLPLYGSEQVKDWPEDMLVVLAEGEPATDALRGAGFHALGTVCGANVVPDREVLEMLRGRRVTLWADNDDAGRAHMAKIARTLQEVAVEVRMFQGDEAPNKGDAADHPAIRSGNANALEPLLNELMHAPVWQPEERNGQVRRNGKLATFTAADLMTTELPPVRWAVPGILPEGVTLLAGKPKIGKGWLVLGMCIATATGGVALGNLHVECGETLYLALEDNRRRLHKRLGKLLNGGTPPPGLHIALTWPRLDQGGTEALDEWLDAHPDARLVVVDTLKKVRPLTSGNRNMYDVDYEALEPLLPLAAEHNVAIVVVHHTRKLAAADPLDEISGSTGLSGGADGVLVIKRDRGRADAYLYVTGREIEEEQELALKWNTNTAGWCIVGDAQEYRLNEARREVIQVLDETRKPMTPREVADALGGDYNATRQRLYQMSRKGEVEIVGRGLYTLPNKANTPNKTHREVDTVVRGSDVEPNNTGDNERPKSAESAPVVRDVRDIRDEADEVIRLFADPPQWLRLQATECVRQGTPDRLLNPLANAVSTHLYGSPWRWREVLPAIEARLKEEAI